ncbi:3-dehydroquinate synthase [Rhodohalobacter sp. 614A]|uniref:3-dehydroquinate synthase n=1 Tax=Rhodohalobacter sp. 614A TaxID=2908649 RepID=UPI001F40D99F|nr:3-dehydroquinate synthase [Rhodohalobacter sp. 614A]
MKTIRQRFSVSYSYDVIFTSGIFDKENQSFVHLITREAHQQQVSKVLFVFDEGMYNQHPGLFDDIRAYHAIHNSVFQLVPEPIVIPGGEAAKNDPAIQNTILEAVEKNGIDRHSYLAVIGGGAVIDAAGYAAAVAHRGIRLIRIPTTVLAQNDASLGVKNGINAFGKKNFLGTFTIPDAVINDVRFLKTLETRDWRAGISEAIKVALIKDRAFFEEIEKTASKLVERDMDAMQQLIYRCAELHLEHIRTSGDPFEKGSSRPLDFGHWAAHKLEHLTGYRLRHGEAVAIGIALDSVYSHLAGMISKEEMSRILNLLAACGFDLFVPELGHQIDEPESKDSILHGLEEFREHLGGQLTIMLLEEIGKGVNVHSMDLETCKEAVNVLKKFEKKPV